MKCNALVPFVILLMLLMVASVQAAGVNNITLTPTCTTGVSGTGTVIVGDVGGSNPYHNVEINVQLNKDPGKSMVYKGWLVSSKDNSKYSLGAFNGQRLNFRNKMVGVQPCNPYDSLVVSLEPANSVNTQPTSIIAKGCLPGTKVAAADFPGSAVLPMDEGFQRDYITKRFCMTASQFNSLRMMGWSSSDIAVIANAAGRCNKSPIDIACQLQQGQSWDQIAASCGTTAAQLLAPVPTQAVAGCRQQTPPATPTPIVSSALVYNRYANGRPVITQRDWITLRKYGFGWQDVAVAANIAALTGERVEPILRASLIQSETWQQIAFERNLFTKRIFDISCWPFSKDGPESIACEDYKNSIGSVGCQANPCPAPNAPVPAPQTGY